MVIIDRTVDPVTPLLHQFTYAGMLDTLYGINVKGIIKVPKGIFDRNMSIAEAKLEGSTEDINLNNEIHEKLIHLSFNHATSRIQTIIRELKEIEDVGSLVLFRLNE
jgi:hypothetical protein